MENTPPVAVETVPLKTGSSKTFAFVVFLLLIVLLASTGGLWHQITQLQREIYQTQKNLSVFATSQKSIKENNDTETSALSQKIKIQQNAISEMNTQLSDLIKRAPGNNSTWKIAEIVYLVRMANLTLTVQHNIPQALILLKQAENQVSSLPNNNLDNFHTALLKNIAALQTLPLLDIDALTTQLSNLSDKVSVLSILVAPKPNTSILDNTPHQSHKKWWQRAWDNIKASMQQLVIVRHHEENVPALMAPEEQMYLQENLKLLLMQAQWAVLNHNAVIYQKSLQQAKSWVEKYYVQNSASTQDFLKQLHGLMNQNIAPTLPDLSQTLLLVHAEGI